MIAFGDACDRVGAALDGPLRRDVVDALASAPTQRLALGRLREPMRSHRWAAGSQRANLGDLIADHDARSRRDHLHVLHDWDGIADAINPETIPVDVLDYLAAETGDERADRTALAVLVDYHFLYLLALLSMRIWDEGDADVNLDRVGGLLRALQGPAGSGHRFVSDAETLMLVATSHYEREERGYHELLVRVRTLNASHRLAIALGHAAAIGSHLRFGIEATYGRDVGAARDDNRTDYPWLAFSLATLVRHIGDDVAGADRDRMVEAVLNGLSADPRAFVGERRPGVLDAAAADWDAWRAGFEIHRFDLVAALDRHRPRPAAYSPIAFFFNFSHNVIKGTVIDALLWGDARAIGLNDLFTALPVDATAGDAKIRLATTLMTYARTHPHKIRSRLMPVIVYDADAGRRAFAVLARELGGTTR